MDKIDLADFCKKLNDIKKEENLLIFTPQALLKLLLKNWN